MHVHYYSTLVEKCGQQCYGAYNLLVSVSSYGPDGFNNPIQYKTNTSN